MSSSKVVTVTAPPGRLGIQLTDSIFDDNKTVISMVLPKSPLSGTVFPGDSIKVINGVDVHDLNTSGKKVWLISKLKFVQFTHAT